MFQTIMDITDFIGNMCVVAITIYTFYLTFYSKRMKVVGWGMTNSVFEGSQIHFSIHSYFMQTFEIQAISIISGNRSIYLQLEQPTIVEPRMTIRICSKQYTRFTELIDVDEILCERQWGLLLHTRDKVLYTSAKRWDSGIRKKYCYRKHKYHRITICNLEWGNVVLSDMVRYVIYVGGDDTPIFMTEDGRLSRMVSDYNVLEKVTGASPKQIRKTIAKLLNISKKNMYVEEVFQLEEEPVQLQLLNENGEDLLEGAEIENIHIKR